MKWKPLSDRVATTAASLLRTPLNWFSTLFHPGCSCFWLQPAAGFPETTLNNVRVNCHNHRHTHKHSEIEREPRPVTLNPHLFSHCLISFTHIRRVTFHLCLSHCEVWTSCLWVSLSECCGPYWFLSVHRSHSPSLAAGQTVVSGWRGSVVTVAIKHPELCYAAYKETARHLLDKDLDVSVLYGTGKRIVKDRMDEKSGFTFHRWILRI